MYPMRHISELEKYYSKIHFKEWLIKREKLKKDKIKETCPTRW